VAIVAVILVAAIVANVVANLYYNQVVDHFPLIGVAVWVAVLATAGIRRPDCRCCRARSRARSSCCRSSLRLDHAGREAPAASWQATFGLGFLSSVFDNIPLTALALKQGGYDWGLLAYAVGFGGSMIWFGSSAGVALSNAFPRRRTWACGCATAGTSPWPTCSDSSCSCWSLAGIPAQARARRGGARRGPAAIPMRRYPVDTCVRGGIAPLDSALLPLPPPRIGLPLIGGCLPLSKKRSNQRENTQEEFMSKTTRRNFLAGRRGAAALAFPMIAKGQAATARPRCAGSRPGRRRTSSTSTRTTSPED
jgi:hypothetical protein